MEFKYTKWCEIDDEEFDEIVADGVRDGETAAEIWERLEEANAIEYDIAEDISEAYDAIMDAITDKMSEIEEAKKKKGKDMSKKNEAITVTKDELNTLIRNAVEQIMKQKSQATPRPSSTIDKEQWLYEHHSNFNLDDSAQFLELNGDARTIVVVRKNRKGKIKIGVAHCHPHDYPMQAIGIAIAYARACGEKVPDIF